MMHRLFLILAPLLTGACAVSPTSPDPAFESRPMTRSPIDTDGGVSHRVGMVARDPGSAPPLVGVASWYGPRHHGKPTASGARYDMRALTAAHPFLPMGTRLRVTHAVTGRSVMVTVNDRGPHVADRILDLSWRAARDLGVLRSGLTTVVVQALPDDAARAPVTPASRKVPARPLRPQVADPQVADRAIVAGGFGRPDGTEHP